MVHGEASYRIRGGLVGRSGEQRIRVVTRWRVRSGQGRGEGGDGVESGVEVA